MCANTPTCCIGPEQAGQRLDVAVGLLFPDCSARARRRLWDSHAILVNGKPRPGGYMVRPGDNIEARPPGDSPPAEQLPCQSPCQSPAPIWMQGELPPHLVAEQQELLFLYKPSGLHTAALAGRGGKSLEALLPSLLPASPEARLVNRLDCGTSGLVVAARTAHGAAQWQRMENAGLCQKHYLTLLCGHLTAPLVMRHELDADKRRVTKVLPTQSTNPLRHSRFTPLGTLNHAQVQALYLALSDPGLHAAPSDAAENYKHHEACGAAEAQPVYTVALCTISKGARHQIRAHASHAGFPLWGDSLYAAPRPGIAAPNTGAEPAQRAEQATSQHFLLHHGRLMLSGATIQCLPPWFPLLPLHIQQLVCSLWPKPA